MKAVAVSGNSADPDNERCSFIRLLDWKQGQREHRGRSDPWTVQGIESSCKGKGQ